MDRSLPCPFPRRRALAALVAPPAQVTGGEGQYARVAALPRQWQPLFEPLSRRVDVTLGVSEA